MRKIITPSPLMDKTYKCTCKKCKAEFSYQFEDTIEREIERSPHENMAIGARPMESLVACPTCSERNRHVESNEIKKE